MRRYGLILAGLSFVMAGSTCSTGPGTPATCDGLQLDGSEQSAGITVNRTTVLTGASLPVSMTITSDNRILFTEKETGRVRVVAADGQLLPDPMVDVPVVFNAERGLLGIALHPNFDQNGWLYLYYTRSSEGDTRTGSAAVDNRVVRFTVNGNVAVGDETLIISLPVRPGGNHNGGNIHFGPDGKLYITIGDVVDSSNSQKIDSLAGRILRLNDDGSIPADNPFGADNATFALGLRNSFDFTFDPVSGGLFATENGTNVHDEVNRLTPGSNGGWPLVEGCAGDTVNVSAGTYVQPIIQSLGIVVPTGIVFVPGRQFGDATEKQMLVAEYQTGRIVRYTLNADRTGIASVAVFADGFSGGLTDLEFGPDGSLYALSIANGTIIRMSP